MLQVSMLQYMYIFVNDDLPAPLLETFVYHRDVHTHATRHQNDPKPPKANSDLLARSFWHLVSFPNSGNSYVQTILLTLHIVFQYWKRMNKTRWKSF